MAKNVETQKSTSQTYSHSEVWYHKKMTPSPPETLPRGSVTVTSCVLLDKTVIFLFRSGYERALCSVKGQFV